LPETILLVVHLDPPDPLLAVPVAADPVGPGGLRPVVVAVVVAHGGLHKFSLLVLARAVTHHPSQPREVRAETRSREEGRAEGREEERQLRRGLHHPPQLVPEEPQTMSRYFFLFVSPELGRAGAGWRGRREESPVFPHRPALARGWQVRICWIGSLYHWWICMAQMSSHHWIADVLYHRTVHPPGISLKEG